MTKRIAVLSDIHGCIDELVELFELVKHESIDEVWLNGDYVDRGPDSGAVVQFCRENNIKGVMGNHEATILELFDRYKGSGFLPKSQDKKRTILSLSDPDVAYLKGLPPIHVWDDIKLIAAHGGVWPKLPLHAQPKSVMWAQLIRPDDGQTRWWGPGAAIRYKRTEEELREEGFKRWYELYDFEEYDTVFGHSVFTDPFIHQNPGYGRCIGIDQGGVFGNYFTALIYPDFRFLKVRAKRAYARMTHAPE